MLGLAFPVRRCGPTGADAATRWGDLQHIDHQGTGVPIAQVHTWRILRALVAALRHAETLVEEPGHLLGCLWTAAFTGRGVLLYSPA